jgi:CheY-like chemotaxis protein
MTAGSLLRDLINDTLELSRIGSGKRQMDWEVVEASHMVDRLVTSMRSAAEQNAVNFHVNLDFADLGYLRLDRLKLSKVLLNLLSNAVKFTPFDGDVWLEGSVLSSTADSCTCRFIVKDTGIGMSPHFLPKMFDPFEQENSMSEKGRMGTGLGLSIAKELLDLMDGKITVESERGKGTTFTVEIPFERVSGEEGLPEVPVEAESVSLDKRLILVCEDNELNREIVKTILEMNGMTVLTAEDGEQGVMTFIESEEYKIDAILMDIRMPVMDGLTSAAQIRQLARPDAHKVPIIALSANAFQEDVEQSRQAGMNDHLTKPVEPDLLLACLSRYIGAYDTQRKG